MSVRLNKRYHLACRDGLWIARTYIPETGQERPHPAKCINFASRDREMVLRWMCEYARRDAVRGRMSCTYLEKVWYMTRERVR